MLCLVAHALFVSATHHHNPTSHSLLSPATASVTAARDGESGSAPDSTSDAHCVSCRLQRNFVSNIHTATVLVQALDEPVLRETHRSLPGSAGSSLLLFGRAPPLS